MEKKGLFVTLSDCTDLAKENDYKKWQDEVLIPSMRKLGFVKKVSRYVNVMNHTPTFLGVPKHLTLWEVAHADLNVAMAEIQKCEAQLKEEGKGFADQVQKVNTLYQQMGDKICTERTGREVKGVYVVFCYNADPARDAEYNEWYTIKHAPETLDLGFLDSSTRFEIVDPKQPEPHQVPQLTVYETSMDPLEARNKLVSFRWKWEPDPIWTDLLQLNYTGAYRLSDSVDL